MSVIAAALAALMEAGVTGDALVAAVAKMEAAQLADRQPARTARQERNARYYESRKARLNASEASESVLNQTTKTVSDADCGQQKDGPQTPKKNYPHSEISLGASAKPLKRQKPKGELCPEDFEPGQSHFEKCRASGVPETVANFTCRKMRNWSRANADRDVAWKADWGRALHSMLDDEIEKHLRQQSKATQAAPASAQQRALDRARQAHFDLMEDRHDQDPSDAGAIGNFGAGRPANGHAGPGVHEPLGRRLGLAPPRPAFPPRAH